MHSPLKLNCISVSVHYMIYFKVLFALCSSVKLKTWSSCPLTTGHVETQTMQTADCTLQTVQTVQTECYFFTCTFSKLCQVKWLKIKPFSASYNGYERDISSISLIVDDRLWFHSVIQTGDLPSFLQILQIPMSSLSSLYIYLKINILIFTCLAVP